MSQPGFRDLRVLVISVLLMWVGVNRDIKGQVLIGYARSLCVFMFNEDIMFADWTITVIMTTAGDLKASERLCSSK